MAEADIPAREPLSKQCENHAHQNLIQKIEAFRNRVLPDHGPHNEALDYECGQYWGLTKALEIIHSQPEIPGEISDANVAEAVNRGNQAYWDDARAQHEAFKQWSANGQKGDGPRISRGSLPEYIIREVTASIKSAPKRELGGQERRDARLIASLRHQITVLEDMKLRRFHNDECWIWQGDGSDFPECLTCPVVMSAQTLRDLLSKIEVR